MATFNVEVKSKKSNGTYKVYIRCYHNGENKYIPTDMFIHESKVNKKKEIKDPYVMGQCSTMIMEFHKKLNLQKDTSKWTADEIIEFVKREDDRISFDDWCKTYIDKIENDYTRSGYKTALSSFKKHFPHKLYFSDITLKELEKWVKSLKKYKRCKESYPRAMKAIFDAGVKEFNEEDKGIIRIQNRPFENLAIPRYDLPEEQAVDVEILRKITEFKPYSKQTEMAVDVAKLIICLAGINTMDLYKRIKKEYKNGELCYNRNKTKDRRRDKAYFEITVLPEIVYLMKKHNNGDRLFDFGYATAKNFNKYVNIGIKKYVGVYNFRHTLASVAQNVFGASDEMLGKYLNHVPALKVTAGYIKRDFTSVDELNRVVTDYILYGKLPEYSTPEIKSVEVSNEMFDMMMICSRLGKDEVEEIASEITAVKDSAFVDVEIYEMINYPYMELNKERFEILKYVVCNISTKFKMNDMDTKWKDEYSRAFKRFCEKNKKISIVS